MSQRLFFINGVIRTLDPAVPQADAVLVDENGRIAFAGKLGDFGTVPTNFKTIDLGGRTLIPGFNDAHVHIWKLGLLLTVQVDARGAAAPSIPAIQAKFRDRAATVPAGTWLTGRGYNEAALPERRHPAADLDAAALDHPIALTRTCGHMIVANSAALKLAHITADTPNPPGGVIVRDEHGVPTGLLQETAMGLITRAIPDYDDETMGGAIARRSSISSRLGSPARPIRC
ncbi:MAG: amidohydrolase family protein [Anaerolineae bacterium]